MTRQEFERQFKNEFEGFDIGEDYTVFTKTKTLWNSKTDEEVKFNTIDELLEYVVDGRTIWEWVKDRDKLFISVYD